MVRTYWLVPVFNEASGNLDLQPFARTATSKPVGPRAMYAQMVARRVRNPNYSVLPIDAVPAMGEVSAP